MISALVEYAKLQGIPYHRLQHAVTPKGVILSGMAAGFARPAFGPCGHEVEESLLLKCRDSSGWTPPSKWQRFVASG
jgi:hypothetical protein